MSSPEKILQIAQTIHAALDEQHPLYNQLGDAIAQLEAGQIDHNHLVLMLASEEDTRQTMSALLGSSATDEFQSKGLSFERLAGQSTPAPAQQYICPTCGYTAYRFGSAIPQCKEHKIDLQPVGNS